MSRAELYESQVFNQVQRVLVILVFMNLGSLGVLCWVSVDVSGHCGVSAREAKHIWLWLGISLKLGPHSRKNRENGREEVNYTILNKNRCIIRTHMGYMRGGGRGRHGGLPLYKQTSFRLRENHSCLSCHAKVTFVAKGTSGHTPV